MIIPSFKHGIIASSFPIPVLSGPIGPPGGDTLYTMYMVGLNDSGCFGNGYSSNLREPIISYDSGGTGISEFASLFDGTYGAVALGHVGLFGSLGRGNDGKEEEEGEEGMLLSNEPT